MAFAKSTQARLPLFPAHAGAFTTLQTSLYAADRPFAPPRFDPGLSTGPGGFATEDPGVSPDRTLTGWLSRACRSATSCSLLCVHGARTAGRTWIEAKNAGRPSDEHPRTGAAGEPGVTAAARAMLRAGVDVDADGYVSARQAASAACTRAGHPQIRSGPIQCITAPCP